MTLGLGTLSALIPVVGTPANCGILSALTVTGAPTQHGAPVLTADKSVAFSHQMFLATGGAEQMEILTQLNALYRDPHTHSQLSTND